MNCTCLQDLEKRLAAKFSEDLGVSAKAECQNEAFMLEGNTMKLAHVTNYKITASAKGFVKGKTVPVTASYCPFCGKSVKTQPAEKKEQAHG
ncbi:hypothetical protein [Pseudogulbenkiania ferrooxidans]|uniref:Uncharacterized protein n=1 Tax=Pseudogulbenkiania ferrooxidans 2002 TaxID=279714 RepID=B9Z4X3_9NEIS|nr:hypothetical protein [Pseudogulbenkiania ferrooxidans]EEG08205.1 hypothetical protein FuraDRAFT_2408 [Pseudogulbenkiania ferrooxidans 2002]